MNSETIHEVQRRCPTACLRRVDGDLYVVARKTSFWDAVGLLSTSIDEAWDSALMLLRQRDVRRAKSLAHLHANDAIEEHKRGIEAKRTTIEDRALKLKEAIQAAMAEFVEGYISVDMPGIEA